MLCSQFQEDLTLTVYDTPDSINAIDCDLVMRFDGMNESVGYIYMTYDVRPELGPAGWWFSFSAATTRMSYELEGTPAIRDAFASLAMASGAALCVLYRERQPEIVITVGDRRLDEPVPGGRWRSLEQLLGVVPVRVRVRRYRGGGIARLAERGWVPAPRAGDPRYVGPCASIVR